MARARKPCVFGLLFPTIPRGIRKKHSSAHAPIPLHTGVCLRWRVLDSVQPLFLGLLVGPQKPRDAERHEDEDGEKCGPRGDCDDLKDIGDEGLAPSPRDTSARPPDATPAAPPVEVVHAGAPVEKDCSKNTPRTTGTMHRKGIDRVVDLQLLQEGGGALIDEAAKDADEQRGSALHVAARRGDRDQAREDAIAHAADVVLPEDRKAERQHHQATRCRGERRVHGHLRGHGPLRGRGHAERGAAVEAVPPEPQDEGAEDDQRQAVWVEGLFAVEAARAGTHHSRADESSNSAAHVHDAAACKVHEACVGDRIIRASSEPAVAPRPVHHHRVDPRGHDDRKDQVPRELNSFGHAAADDGRGCRAEGPLEEPIQHVRGGGEDAVAVHLCEAHAEGLVVVGEGVVLAVGDAVRQRPPDGPPTHRAETDVNHVLHQDVLHVLGAAAAGLDHGETSLHEHDQRAAEEEPRVIRCALEVRDGFSIGCPPGCVGGNACSLRGIKPTVLCGLQLLDALQQCRFRLRARIRQALPL
mmetsp:Transcript_144860/g.367630  ORF Transcript_144860/g.367630 Transcript_144860/m.367630 type:complete len:527 (-) Transcript_144860:203-1783(-)